MTRHNRSTNEKKSQSLTQFRHATVFCTKTKGIHAKREKKIKEKHQIRSEILSWHARAHAIAHIHAPSYLRELAIICEKSVQRNLTSAAVHGIRFFRLSNTIISLRNCLPPSPPTVVFLSLCAQCRRTFFMYG